MLHYALIITPSNAVPAVEIAPNVCLFKPGYVPIINSPVGGLWMTGHVGNDGNMIVSPTRATPAGGKMYASGSFVVK